jgi:hypothetical protein
MASVQLLRESDLLGEPSDEKLEQITRLCREEVYPGRAAIVQEDEVRALRAFRLSAISAPTPNPFPKSVDSPPSRPPRLPSFRDPRSQHSLPPNHPSRP